MVKSTSFEGDSQISEFQIFRILDHLRHRASGLDGIPAWFLRLAAPTLAAHIADMFNMSLAASYVPWQWKMAAIHPIPKIPSPSGPGRSGLAVACLTAVREVLGSNCAVGSCVYRTTTAILQPWVRAVCTLPAVPRSTQPSTLRGTVNEYQLSG